MCANMSSLWLDVHWFMTSAKSNCTWTLWWLLPRVRGLLGKRSTVHSPPALFFKKCISARAHQFNFLSQDQSTVARRTETATAECSLTSCVWARFPEFPTLCLDSIVSPLRLRWVKDVCMFGCNLPPVLLAEWPRSFTRHCGNTGWNGHRTRVSTDG